MAIAHPPARTLDYGRLTVGSPAVTIRLATRDDVPRIAEVLAHAFAADPPMRWVMGASPHAERRLRPYFSALLARLHMARGEVWMSDEPLGAAAWVGPGGWPPPAALELRLAPVLIRTFARHPLRAAGAGRVSVRPHPAERHWFLDYIGVEATARGRGAGSALMRPVLDRCDAEGIGAFLNAGSERSRDLYARHGFEVTRRVELPRGGPPLWSMWRAPG
jgi:GNAT superfamily N-acetyltransferase